MSLPTINGVGRLTEEPELRYTAAGSPVARLRLAFNSRKKDQSGQWVDDAVLYLDGSAFGPVAENIASTLQRGMEVVVSGRLKTNSWEDKQGQRQQRTELLVDSIGPSLRSATAQVEKAGGQGSGRQEFQRARQAQGAASAEDPWAPPAPGQSQAGGWDEAPPF